MPSLSVPPARAVLSTSQSPHPAVVRIVAFEGKTTSLGSGTLIHVTQDFGLVITNWHVVRCANGPVEVIFPDGFRSGGTVMKLDDAWDLAAVGIWRPKASPVRLAKQTPKQGDWLSIAGYGGGNYRAASGRCTQYVAPARNQPFEMVELSTEARQGDSGGPIFNVDGELAGVLLGAKRGHTIGSVCSRVDYFLADVSATLQREQAQRIAANRSRDPKNKEKADMIDSTTKNPWVGGRPVAVAATNSRSFPDRLLGRPVQPATAPAMLPEINRFHVQWHRHLVNYLGDTPIDQVKTFFATLGGFSVLLSCLRLFKFEG